MYLEKIAREAGYKENVIIKTKIVLRTTLIKLRVLLGKFYWSE